MAESVLLLPYEGGGLLRPVDVAQHLEGGFATYLPGLPRAARGAAVRVLYLDKKNINILKMYVASSK